MSNATRWYCTRESAKQAGGIQGAALDPIIDSYIESASQDIEGHLRHVFIPYLATHAFDTPTRSNPNARLLLELNRDLLSLTAFTKDGDAATPLLPSDYALRPYNQQRKRIVELYPGAAVFSNDAAWWKGAYPDQKTWSLLASENPALTGALRLTGEWGYCNDTKPAGQAGALADETGTELDVSDASLVGVGDTLLFDAERLFVSERSPLATGTTLATDISEEDNDRSLNLVDGSKVRRGELLYIGAERLLVEAVMGNQAQVTRAQDASQIEAHYSGEPVFALRRLTVVRGINGSTAAVHAGGPIFKYAPPGDIVDLCRANTIAHHEMGKSGWTGLIGGGGQAMETKMSSVYYLCEAAKKKYTDESLG